MSTASLTIVPPPGIRAIRDSYASSRLRELESQHTSTSAELEIARSYLTDNQQLKSELTGLKESLAQMTSRAESAEYALEQAKISGTGSAEAEEISDDDATPIAGEIRFYKKTHSKPGYDVFVKVNDCGHAAWQPATKADKAKKGLERITGGNNWKNLQHCGTCTGGGMWKVRW